MMNLACLLKLCPCSLKCLQARMELGFFVSFLWLFNPRLNVVSAFLAYCILYNMHSSREKTHSLLQLTLREILNVCFVCWLVSVFVVITWLQRKVIAPDKHGVHFPVLRGILNFLTLSFLIRVPQIISFRFLFVLKTVIRSLGIIDFCWFGGIFQFLQTTSLRFDKNWLCVNYD